MERCGIQMCVVTCYNLTASIESRMLENDSAEYYSTHVLQYTVSEQTTEYLVVVVCTQFFRFTVLSTHIPGMTW